MIGLLDLIEDPEVAEPNGVSVHIALSDPSMEQRRQEVLKMLRQNPKITRASVADGDLDPVRIHLAVRGVGSCELTIAADKWDPLKFARLLELMPEDSESSNEYWEGN